MPFAAAQAATSTATVSTTLRVSLVIVSSSPVEFPSCTVNGLAPVDFAEVRIVSANLDAAGWIDVSCQAGAPYSIRIDEGNARRSVIDRRMRDAGGSIYYALFQDRLRSQNWGRTDGVDAMSAIGSGGSQIFRIFGRMPVPSVAWPAKFFDLVGVAIVY